MEILRTYTNVLQYGDSRRIAGLWGEMQISLLELLPHGKLSILRPLAEELLTKPLLFVPVERTGNNL